LKVCYGALEDFQLELFFFLFARSTLFVRNGGLPPRSAILPVSIVIFIIIVVLIPAVVITGLFISIHVLPPAIICRDELAEGTKGFIYLRPPCLFDDGVI